MSHKIINYQCPGYPCNLVFTKMRITEEDHKNESFPVTKLNYTQIHPNISYYTILPTLQ